MSELLTDCIAFTGDVDTVAAIALAAGSCSREIQPDLPAHLIDALENGPYGSEKLPGGKPSKQTFQDKDYLIELDKQLMNIEYGNTGCVHVEITIHTNSAKSVTYTLDAGKQYRIDWNGSQKLWDVSQD